MERHPSKQDEERSLPRGRECVDHSESDGVGRQGTGTVGQSARGNGQTCGPHNEEVENGIVQERTADAPLRALGSSILYDYK